MFQDTVKESFFHLIFTEDFLLANCYSRRKSFLNNCTTKETISKVKRQPSEWEKIIANEAIDEQLISKIYKQLLQLNSRKINDQIKKNGPKN